MLPHQSLRSGAIGSELKPSLSFLSSFLFLCGSGILKLQYTKHDERFSQFPSDNKENYEWLRVTYSIGEICFIQDKSSARSLTIRT